MNLADEKLGPILNYFDGQPVEYMLRFQYATNHGDRFFYLRKILDCTCNQLERNKHKKQNLDEDQLTIELCQAFDNLGFRASHDEQFGGHCDIVIKGKDNFLWIAEAKKHSDYNWLDQGFKQLSTRYSTGVAGQDSGDIIIYCKVSNSLSMLNNWKDRLLEKNDHVKIVSFNLDGKLEFWSQHDHVATGMPFTVRHKVVSLYFKPQDK